MLLAALLALAALEHVFMVMPLPVMKPVELAPRIPRNVGQRQCRTSHAIEPAPAVPAAQPKSALRSPGEDP